MEAIYGCAFPQIIHSLFENEHFYNKSKMIKNEGHEDINAEELMFLLSSDSPFSDDPRRKILENIACYAKSLDTKIRVVGELADEFLYVKGDLGGPNELPKYDGIGRIPPQWTTLYFIPHDKRFAAITDIHWKSMRIRFQYLDSIVDFRQAGKGYDETYEFQKQFWKNGEKDFPYIDKDVEEDKKLLGKLWMGDSSEQVKQILEESKSINKRSWKFLQDS